MFKVVYKDNKSWFNEPIIAEEVIPAKDWEVKEFSTYEEAEDFIESIK